MQNLLPKAMPHAPITNKVTRGGAPKTAIILLGPEDQPIIDDMQAAVLHQRGIVPIGFVDPTMRACQPTDDGLMIYAGMLAAQRAHPDAGFVYEGSILFAALDFVITSDHPDTDTVGGDTCHT